MRQIFFFIFTVVFGMTNAQTLNIVHKESPLTSGVHLQFNENDPYPEINVFQWEGANFYGYIPQSSIRLYQYIVRKLLA